VKTFKTFLTEGASAALNFASWNMSTLLDAYVNAGYDLSQQERKTFKAMKFNPKSGKKPYFWVLCENDSGDDGEYYITTIHLEFTSDGKIGAEPAGMPGAEGTYAEMKKEFEKL
jgi:hypothetical protein